MRRGTPSAMFFGQLLCELRTYKQFSMRHIARKIGVPAATVSQVEKAQRAVKEPKLAAWASALEVDETFLRERWLFFQKEYPDPPILRTHHKTRTKDQVLVLFDQLTGVERSLVTGYIHRLLEEREE
jgi:transcriptional regulator with XRE-family HTH domain